MKLPQRSLALASLFWLGGCAEEPAAGHRWHLVASGQPEAFFSVSGRGARDVWVVGADRGRGPVVLRFDGAAWRRVETGHRGDLWWVQPYGDGTALLAGDGGAALRFADGAFRRISTPGLGRQTVFGVWGDSPAETWLVGGAAGRDGFAWRLRGEDCRDMALPLDLPRRADRELPALLKVWGDGAGDLWLTGDRGALLHRRGEGPIEVVPTATTERLFTVHGRGDDVVAVGGTGRGLILERAHGFAQRAPEATPLLQGVFVGADGAWAVGQSGAILERGAEGWRALEPGFNVPGESLHAVWGDGEGGLWAAGGNVLSTRLDGGVLLYRGPAPPPPLPEPAPAPPPAESCPEPEVDPAPAGSIARRWNELALGAIRRDLPQPTVHARNLFHLSAALYDVWAAYDRTAVGYLVRERRAAADVAAARAEAMSYAAYRILARRYGKAIGAGTSTACFRALLSRLGYDAADEGTGGDGPRALGNRVARAYLNSFADDGANEAGGYADTTGFQAANPPLVVDLPGAEVRDPARWQPLNLAVAATQNGIVLPAGVQRYIGAHWGLVRPFSLVRAGADRPYVDPGPGPGFSPDTMAPWVLDVLTMTRDLDPASEATLDASPASTGGNSLGADDGRGHAVNPVTGRPYEPAITLRSDFGRVLAEHWADGPRSETPPGHWNVIANRVADDPRLRRRLFGAGAEVDALEWDVKVHFALNGALHDAAIAAWEIKRRFDAARPITLIRYMAAQGQRSEPAAPDYSPAGLPLVPGLVERISDESTAPGGRHEHLRHFQGELALRSWRGEPGDRRGEVGGVGWIRAAEWLPYQRRNFVTPAFPGFISGHSTFSRAAAEVLASITGSPYFPGGLAEFVAQPDSYLQFERGPRRAVRLQWATYFDAADQAGQSRRYGGIHIVPDDHAGRRVGNAVGLAALAKVRPYFDGTAPGAPRRIR